MSEHKKPLSQAAAEVLYSLVKSSKFTYAEIAQRMGTSEIRIQRLLTGKTILDLDTIYAIISIIGVNLNEVIDAAEQRYRGAGENRKQIIIFNVNNGG